MWNIINIALNLKKDNILLL